MRDDAATVRPVTRLVKGVPASDGAGVKLLRVIRTETLPDVDPFLLLDEIRSDSGGDYAAGFPDHPHRGFETVTYVLAGRMRHGDNHGNSWAPDPGSQQWTDRRARHRPFRDAQARKNGLMCGLSALGQSPGQG